jgi:UTP--glucose-1-phosphate uridylyltransferase
MTKVRKAVVTAAGRGTRHYPASQTVQKELFPLVDVDGYTKPTLQIIVEEALSAGIEEICIVVNPTNAEALKSHFKGMSRNQLDSQFSGKPWAHELAKRLADIEDRLTFVVQAEQHGFGHAVAQAGPWANGEPVAVLLGDHIYLSETVQPCTRQLIQVFERYGVPLSSVANTPERIIHRLGTVRGEPVPDAGRGVYRVADMMEKPPVEQARARLRTPGLPDGEYLCFFGIHVFTPAIFDCLNELIANDQREFGEIQLTSAQKLLHERGEYIVSEIQGERYDMGVPEGYIETQVALALRSPFRDAVTHLAAA